MALEPDFEAAARKLCKMRGMNPDVLVTHSPGIPANMPIWRKYAAEIQNHHELMQSLNGTWVEKKIAGAAPDDGSDLV